MSLSHKNSTGSSSSVAAISTIKFHFKITVMSRSPIDRLDFLGDHKYNKNCDLCSVLIPLTVRQLLSLPPAKYIVGYNKSVGPMTPSENL